MLYFSSSYGKKRRSTKKSSVNAPLASRKDVPCQLPTMRQATHPNIFGCLKRNLGPFRHKVLKHSSGLLNRKPQLRGNLRILWGLTGLHQAFYDDVAGLI